MGLIFFPSDFILRDIVKQLYHLYSQSSSLFKFVHFRDVVTLADLLTHIPDIEPPNHFAAFKIFF